MAKVIVCDICGKRITQGLISASQFILPMYREDNKKSLEIKPVDLCLNCQKAIANFCFDYITAE